MGAAAVGESVSPASPPTNAPISVLVAPVEGIIAADGVEWVEDVAGPKIPCKRSMLLLEGTLAAPDTAGVVEEEAQAAGVGVIPISKEAFEEPPVATVLADS